MKVVIRGEKDQRPGMRTIVEIGMYRVTLTINYNSSYHFKTLLAEMVRCLDIGDAVYDTYFNAIHDITDMADTVLDMQITKPNGLRLFAFYRPSRNDSFTFFCRGIEGKVSGFVFEDGMPRYMGSSDFLHIRYT